MSKEIQSCSNYFCEAYKDNTCQRCLNHRLKLYEKRLDDNHISIRNNIKMCDMFVEVKGK